MSCNNCFPDWICKCVPYDNFIQINAAGIATAFYRVTDGKGNQVSGQAIANSVNVQIPLADLPDGFFSPYGGPYSVELFDAADQCVKIPMLLSKFYDCVEIEVRNDTLEKNTIGCV